MTGYQVPRGEDIYEMKVEAGQTLLLICLNSSLIIKVSKYS